MTRTVVLAGAICVCLALSVCVAACGADSSQRDGSRGQDPAGGGPGQAFLNTYMVTGGRIQRTDQGGDTVSEGQAYGMLIAAAIGDERRFDEIWSWTRAHLQQPSGLLAWHWANGRVASTQPASDADLDAARALLVGACRFGRPALRKEAVRIGRAVLAHQTARAGSLQVLLAGPWANQGAHLVFNPSYVDPVTLTALAHASGDAQFNAVAAGGRQLVDELTRPLPPDWAIISTDSGQPTPVSGASSTKGPGTFTYDAPRTLVRFATDADPSGRAAVARAWDVFRKTSPQDIVTEHQLSGTAVGSVHSPITLVAVAGAAKAAGDTAAIGPLLDEAEKLNRQHPTYYGSAWVALGRFLLTTDRLQPCG